jgi:glycosyltransferase involved in cell wall biosynthesis
VARALGLPLVGSYHTELTAYAGMRSGEQRVAAAMAMAVSTFYGACDVVLSPSSAADAALAAMGMSGERVMRWDRGVDTSRFRPRPRASARELKAPTVPAGTHPDMGADTGTETITVLYSGRITREKGVDLLADAFLLARACDPRLRLALAGGGPEQERLRERLGDGASFLGWLEGDDLARAYAAADMFLCPSSTDTFGQVILEAQASGLPVVAVAVGGPLSLVKHRESGLLCQADAAQLAAALLQLAESPLLREHLSRGGLAATKERTWERTLERLAAGYRRVLGDDSPAELAHAA